MSESSSNSEATPLLKTDTSPLINNDVIQPTNHLDIDLSSADVTFNLINQIGGEVPELTPEKERKLKKKLWLTVLPLCFMVNATLFLEKDCVAYSSLTGLFEDTGMDKTDYNNVLTLFYVGYIIGQVPSHYIFQKVPMSKYIVGVTAVWSILGYSMLACKSYASVATVRFFLGLFESGITPAMEHTLAMFFPLEDQAIVNPIFWVSCTGVDIPIGFLAYGLQHTTIWRPWKWFWLIAGIASNVACVITYFYFPDNPASTHLFTTEEKIHIIQRVKKSTSSAIEQKTFKTYQLIESLKDKITWLFILYCFLQMIENATAYQASIIYTELGFSNLTTTLLMVVQNGLSTTCAITNSFLLTRFRSQSVYLACCCCAICFIGAITAISLPDSNKAGILTGIFMTRPNGTAYILAFSLSQATAAGYTKRLTRTAGFMIAYSIANIIAPQMWKPQFAPRYRVPWTIQMICSWFTAPMILLIIRAILSRRNKERKEAIARGEVDQFGYVEVKNTDGTVSKKRVEISMLDLTDLENKNFIYPL